MFVCSPNVSSHGAIPTLTFHLRKVFYSTWALSPDRGCLTCFSFYVDWSKACSCWRFHSSEGFLPLLGFSRESVIESRLTAYPSLMLSLLPWLMLRVEPPSNVPFFPWRPGWPSFFFIRIAPWFANKYSQILSASIFEKYCDATCCAVQKVSSQRPPKPRLVKLGGIICQVLKPFQPWASWFLIQRLSRFSRQR